MKEKHLLTMGFLSRVIILGNVDRHALVDLPPTKLLFFEVQPLVHNLDRVRPLVN